MTTSLLLHPRWPESLMYVYEDSAAESGSGGGGGGGGGGGAGGAGGGCSGASPGKAPSMDGLGSSCPASHCRDLLPHPVLGRPPAPLGAPQGAVYTDIPAPEAARQCAPPPAPPTSSSATLGYGYPFGGSYYGCRLSHNVNLQQKPCAYHPGDKYPEPSGALPGDDLSSRAKEFAFYPSFASSYQAMPGYLDVSVVPGISGHPEPRHDALIPVEGYQHWALSNGWDSQVYCSKEQSQSAHLWKSPFPGSIDTTRGLSFQMFPHLQIPLPFQTRRQTMKGDFFQKARLKTWSPYSPRSTAIGAGARNACPTPRCS
eukprot:XP_023978498.1 homeobox protein Hox-C13 isoform X2 [Physeter catodon]